MTNKAMSFIAIFALVTSVIAGGDDRDRGPVEPIFDKVVVKDSAAKTMTLSKEPMLVDEATNKVVETPSGTPITIKAHEACKDRLDLSNYNIEKFKAALAGKYLYNVGPLNELGTEFSPARWDDYFECVENQ